MIKPPNPFNPPNAYDKLQEAKQLIKNMGTNPTPQDYAKIKETAAEARKLAQNEIADSFKTNKTRAQMENFVVKVFEKFAKTFNKAGAGSKTDLGKMIMMLVLIGGILKDYINGVVILIQTYLNPDLSKERKEWLITYDMIATHLSAVLSLVSGPMVFDKITKGFESALKPLAGKQKQIMLIQGLAACTTLILQQIIVKRIIMMGLSMKLTEKLKKQAEPAPGLAPPSTRQP